MNCIKNTNKLNAFIITTFIFSLGFSGLTNIFLENLKYIILIIGTTVIIFLNTKPTVLKNYKIPFNPLSLLYILLIVSYFICTELITSISLAIGFLVLVIFLNKPITLELTIRYYYKVGILIIYLGIIQFLIFIIFPELIPSEKTNFSSSFGGSKILISPIEYIGFVSDYTSSFGFSYRRLMGYVVEPSATGYLLIPLLYISLFKIKDKISSLSILFYIFICSQSILVVAAVILILSALIYSIVLEKNISKILAILITLFLIYLLYFVSSEILYDIFISINSLFNNQFVIFLKKHDSFIERLSDIRGVNLYLDNCSDSMGGIVRGLSNKMDHFGSLLGIFLFFIFSISFIIRKNNFYKNIYVYFSLFIIFFINGYGWITLPGFITLSIMYLDAIKNYD